MYITICSRPRVQSPKKSSLQQRLSRSASKFAASFQGGAPHAQPIVTVSNPDDMSSSLLRGDSDRSPAGNINPSVNFFGNFKGFSLTPMDKNAPAEAEPEAGKPRVADVAKSAKITPVHRSGSNSQNIASQGAPKSVLRAAPPLPVVPAAAAKRASPAAPARLAPSAAPSAAPAPSAVPPAAAPPRPVISSPILEASTCTAKELISPLQGSRTLARAAPAAPAPASPGARRPLSMHAPAGPQKPLPDEPRKVREGISLNRIASFLRPDRPRDRNPVERSHSLPKNAAHQTHQAHQAQQARARGAGPLRALQISNPIPQRDIELPAGAVPVAAGAGAGAGGEESRAFVARAQSMRAPAAARAALPGFGSVRLAARPASVVGRPTAPPPPAPADPPSEYQSPKPAAEARPVDYVDCVEEQPAPLAHIDEEASDNIYAVIEESPERRAPQPTRTPPRPPPDGYIAPRPLPPPSGSTDSMGLLGEIVDEIQNRNFDSIYSASTLSRRKGGRKSDVEGADETYSNADACRPAESVYGDSGAKSTASTTSSGYLHPSAVNVPAPPAPPSPKAGSKIPTFARQVTPPGLRNTSTFRGVPQSPKVATRPATQKMSNSPDVVSCSVADAKSGKAPDVVNNNKPTETPRLAVKPTVVVKPNDNRPPLRPAPTVDKKPLPKTTPTLKPVNSSSNLKPTDKAPAGRVTAKTDSNVKALADSLNKNKPKVVPKPTALVQRADSAKSAAPKLAAKPSNVASLQQKFENRKSLGKEITTGKK